MGSFMATHMNPSEARIDYAGEPPVLRSPPESSLRGTSLCAKIRNFPSLEMST